MNANKSISCEECIYTHCYCEENVFKLCEKIKDTDSKMFMNSYVVFISNKKRAVPLWCQKSSTNENGFTVWDYHVILVTSEPENSKVYDFDTSLPFPCSFADYINYGIRNEHNFLPEYKREFRVMKASEYIDNLSSDRSHMLKPDGSWIKSPPSYEPIYKKDKGNNLDSFISMDSETGVGSVLSLEKLVSFFS